MYAEFHRRRPDLRRDLPAQWLPNWVICIFKQVIGPRPDKGSIRRIIHRDKHSAIRINTGDLIMKATILAVSCGAFLLCFAVVGQATAQTPDGETPANEDVCDGLIGATPGLYGLCVAFCEAQDCEPDFSLDDPFENCNPSGQKILERYNARKQENEPDMPCLQTPCPCWNSDEVTATLDPPIIALENCFSGGGNDQWLQATADLTTYVAGMQTAVGEDFRVCTFVLRDEEFGTNISRAFSITAEEYDICNADVIATGQALGFTCWE